MIVPVIAIVIASVLFIVLIIAVVLLVRRVFKKDPATDTSTSLITAGLSLVVSSFPGCHRRAVISLYFLILLYTARVDFCHSIYISTQAFIRTVSFGV